MNSESEDDVIFKEYRELEPMSKSLGQCLIAVIHLAVAVLISVIQLNDGISVWFLGFGVVDAPTDNK